MSILKTVLISRVSQVGDTHLRRDTLSWGHDFQFTIENLTSKIMLDSRKNICFTQKLHQKTLADGSADFQR